MALKRPSVNANKYADDDDIKVPGKAEEPDEDNLYEDEDPNEDPKVGTNIQSGWGAAKKAYDEAPKGDYTGEFKWTDEPQLIKFIGEGGPIAVYSQHWIDNPPSDITKKKSFVCLKSVGEKTCPLCTIGDVAKPKWAFAVTVIGEDVSDAQVMTAGPKLFEILEAKNNARTGPLEKHFYSVYSKKKPNNVDYFVDVVRGSDLAEEWDLDAADVEAAVKEVEMLDKKDAFVLTKRSDLTEIARAIA